MWQSLMAQFVSAKLRRIAFLLLAGSCRLFISSKEKMLYTIAVVMLVLWLLGLVTSYTIGGFIHVLLVIAIVVILIRIIKGRRPF